MSERVLEGLETIDDELGRNHVLVVKMMSTPSNNFSALQITNLPAIVFYDNKVPTIFDGEDAIFSPLSHLTAALSLQSIMYIFNFR